MLEYHSVASLLTEAEKIGCTISRLVLEDQAALMEQSIEKTYSLMKENLDIMRKAADSGSEEKIKSLSGLSGGDGFRMKQYAGNTKSISGDFCTAAMAKAIAISECNASMGRIVASPTAGSCGIIPAALLAMDDVFNVQEEKLVMGLFTAGAFGLVIVNEATISGAEGGCQAECGSASAMAAAALVEIMGGSPVQSAEACAIALKNQLGLVCDPVAGLVEVPCIKRNAAGVMCAIAAADMALAGIKSVIPVDEVIVAMGEVGNLMPSSLKETAQAGLAATPTGIALKHKIFG